MKESIIRSLTGIVIIAVILLSLVIHTYTFLIAFTIACLFAWLEFARMFGKNILPGMRITIAIFLCAGFILAYFIASGRLAFHWLLFPAAGMMILPFLLKFKGPPSTFSRILLISMAVLYLLTGFFFLPFLAFPEGIAGYSYRWILFTFYFLWINDSMAYVSGRLLGKHSIWPSVSPSKTWEGIFGGAVFTIALAIIFSLYFPVLSTFEWTGFAGIVILFGSLGDFFESWLKRKAGVKDSGRILPGHGGILDRLDSLLLAVPFVTIYLKFIL